MGRATGDIEVGRITGVAGIVAGDVELAEGIGGDVVEAVGGASRDLILSNGIAVA